MSVFKKLLLVGVIFGGLNAAAENNSSLDEKYANLEGGLQIAVHYPTGHTLEITGTNGDKMEFTLDASAAPKADSNIYKNNRCTIKVKDIILKDTEIKKNLRLIGRNGYIGVTVEVLNGANECRLESQKDTDKVEVTGFYANN